MTGATVSGCNKMHFTALALPGPIQAGVFKYRSPYLRLREWKATPSTKGAPRMTMPEPSMLIGCPQQYINFRTIPTIGMAASARMSLVAIG